MKENMQNAFNYPVNLGKYNPREESYRRCFERLIAQKDLEFKIHAEIEKIDICPDYKITAAFNALDYPEFTFDENGSRRIYKLNPLPIYFELDQPLRDGMDWKKITKERYDFVKKKLEADNYQMRIYPDTYYPEKMSYSGIAHLIPSDVSFNNCLFVTRIGFKRIDLPPLQKLYDQWGEVYNR